MIDRTLLTEALDKWRNPASFPLEDVEGLTMILNAALWARDFPTDEQVEAAAGALIERYPDTFGPWLAEGSAKTVLVAVRDTMIGDNHIGDTDG